MLELWQTIFTGLTFVVFTMSYQMTAASGILQNYWTPQMQEWARDQIDTNSPVARDVRRFEYLATLRTAVNDAS